MSAITKLDEAVRLLKEAASDMAAAGAPVVTLRPLDSLAHELIGYISDLPNRLAEDVFEDSELCIGCRHLSSSSQRLAYGDRYTVRTDCGCAAPGASDCPVVQRVFKPQAWKA